MIHEIEDKIYVLLHQKVFRATYRRQEDAWINQNCSIQFRKPIRNLEANLERSGVRASLRESTGALGSVCMQSRSQICTTCRILENVCSRSYVCEAHHCETVNAKGIFKTRFFQ